MGNGPLGREAALLIGNKGSWNTRTQASEKKQGRLPLVGVHLAMPGLLLLVGRTSGRVHPFRATLLDCRGALGSRPEENIGEASQNKRRHCHEESPSEAVCAFRLGTCTCVGIVALSGVGSSNFRFLTVPQETLTTMRAESTCPPPLSLLALPSYER